MSEALTGKEIFDKLSYTKKNVYEVASADEVKAIYDYAKGYMHYLDVAKTEREATAEAIAMAERAGYTEYKLGDKLTELPGIFKADSADKACLGIKYLCILS